MNRSTKLGLFIGYGLFGLSLIACTTENQDNPIIRKGVISDKQYIASHWVKISTNGVAYKIPDTYCITLKGDAVVKGTRGEYVVTAQTVYIVPSSVFGESEIGRSVDFTGNPNVELAHTCSNCPTTYPAH